MPIHIDPVCFVLRAGQAMEKFGDGYELSGTLVVLEPGVIKVVGVSGVMYSGFMVEVKEFARKNGIRKVFWERIKNGIAKEVVLAIN